MLNLAAFPVGTRINQHFLEHFIDDLSGVILGGCLSDLLDPPISIISPDFVKKVRNLEIAEFVPHFTYFGQLD